MTDKQIIIDEVKCPWFNDGSCDLFYSDKEECWYRKCKDTPNCYYRETQTQLKRSEAQCEAMFVSHTDLEKKYKAKEQECEEFRKANDEKNELLAKLGCPTIATARRKVFCLQQQQLDQLKAENEELKGLNTRLDNQREAYWKGYQKLKATLTEIKEIAMGIMDDDLEASFAYYDAKQILQKISDLEV